MSKFKAGTKQASVGTAKAVADDGRVLGTAAGSLVRNAGRDPEWVEFEREVVSFFLDAADLLGIPKSVAAIYGICFAAEQPLTFADIEGRLNISKGSISQGLRVLREVGALKVLTAPLERRDRFEPDLELRRLVAHFVEQRMERQLDSGARRLQTIEAHIPATSGSAAILRTRLATLQNWHDKARGVLPLVKTFLKLTS